MGFVKLQTLDAATQAQLLATHLPLGRHPKTGDVFLTREVDRFSGMLVFGVAGSGKSGLMQNLILADIAKGHAVIVIDPHGDLADNVLATMPPERLEQTFVLDMLDEKHPFTVNFLKTPQPWSEMTHADRTAFVERTKHVIRVLFGEEVTKQAHLSRFLTNATILLLSNPNTTFYDMMRVLSDPSYRQQLLRQVDDPDVRNFWQREFEELSEAKRRTVTDPLMGRLQQIFVGHPITRNILSQPHTSVDFRRAIEQRQNIMVKVPKQKLRQDAEVIGTVIVACIHSALFSFADVPQEQRPGFSLFIDEFQSFVTKDIEDFVLEGRKFGIRLTVAHQLRSQLNDDLRSATAAMRTKLCFQAEAGDASDMARYFPAPDDGRLAEVDAHASLALLKDPGSDYWVRLFTNLYLRPLQSQRKGGRIKIEQPGLSLGSILWLGYDDAAKAAKKAEPPTEEDPTQYLDDLLRDVMQSRNPHLSIPPKAVKGFAMCGHGFYSVVKHLRPCAELAGGYAFPPQLVAGDQWLRAPKNEHEQFLHFVFTLRGAMRALAVHPLGKKAEASTAAVAQLLTQLPRRHALVRSGDDIGRIITEDTAPRLDGVALQERLRRIQAQTRATYCRSRDEVERALRGEATSDDSRDEAGGAIPLPRISVSVHHAAQSRPRSRWTEIDEP